MSRVKIKVKTKERYGLLRIIGEVKNKGKERRFKCICDCSNVTTVNLSNLRNGNTKSCGCLKNLPPTEEVRLKIQKTHRQIVDSGLSKLFKGDKASYAAKHIYLKNRYGRAQKCQQKGCKYPRLNSKGICMDKPKRYEWANITGVYTHRREDYVQLCPSCHRRFDLGLLELKIIK